MYDAPATILSVTRPYHSHIVPKWNYSDWWSVLKVIVKTLKALQWEYFAIIYGTDPDGSDLKNAVVSQAASEGLCVAGLVGVTWDDDDSVDTIRDALHKTVQMKVTGVVYLAWGNHIVLENIQNVPDAGKLQFLFPDTLGPDEELVDDLKYARGILTVSPSQRYITEFEDHWVGLNVNDPIPDNPWFQEWYMTKEKCRLPGFSNPPYNTYPNCALKTESEMRDEYEQLKYTEASIVAVYTYAKAVKDAHADLCGPFFRGMCDQLIDLPSEDFFANYVRELDFTFSTDERVPTLASTTTAPYFAAKRVRYDNKGDLQEAMYDIWSYNDFDGDFKFQMVATFPVGDEKVDFIDGSVIFYNGSRDEALLMPAISPCPADGCLDCISSDENGAIKYAYIDGDLLIGGLFSAHREGADGFSCGEVHSEGAQLMQAFLYALEHSSSILHPGVQLGGIALDECESGFIASRIMQEIHTNKEVVIGGETHAIDPANIKVYVGSHTNAVTEQSASVLEELSLPLIGYRAMQDDLSTSSLFARTLVSQDVEARAIVMLLRSQRWWYVQALHDSSSQSTLLMGKIRDHAKKAGICVSQEVLLQQSVSYNAFVMTFLAMSSDRRQVMVLVGDSDLQRNVFQAVKAANLVGRFTFVSAIGLTKKAIEGVEDAAEGTLGVNFPDVAIGGFQTHLEDLNPKTYTANPFFSDWYESTYQCYLDPLNMKGYGTECSGDPITSSDNYIQDPHAIFVINAVQAIAHGLDATLKYYCGDTYNSVCSAIYTSADVSDNLMQNILAAEFITEAGDTFSFTDGQAQMLLPVYNVNGGLLKKVGSYLYEGEDTEHFQLDAEELKYGTVTKPDPTCMDGVTSFCYDCQKVYDGVNEYMVLPGNSYIAAVFDLHEGVPNPFGCGSELATKQSYQYTEAMKYAIEKVNNKEAPVSLNGITLGGVILDGCSSKAKGAQLMSGLHSEAVKLLYNGGASSFQPGAIFAWLSGGTNSALEMGDISGELGIVQLGVATSSSVFNDVERLPTFFNTMNTDDTMIQGMLRLVKWSGWRYIQLVYANSDWGRQGADDTIKAAKSLGICVLAAYELDTDGAYKDIVEKLAEAPTDIVITIVTSDELSNFMQAKQGKDLTVISSETQGSLNSLSSSVGKAATDLLVFKHNSVMVDDFDTYLSSKYPDTYNENPWFHDYYQKLHKCDLSSKHSNFEFGVPCTATNTTALTDALDYEQDPFIVNVINAVYAAAQVVDLLVTDTCGEDYDGACPEFYDIDPFELTLKMMANINFTDPNGLQFTFEERQRNAGYLIYRFDEEGNSGQVLLQKIRL